MATSTEEFVKIKLEPRDNDHPSYHHARRLTHIWVRLEKIEADVKSEEGEDEGEVRVKSEPADNDGVRMKLEGSEVRVKTELSEEGFSVKEEEGEGEGEGIMGEERE